MKNTIAAGEFKAKCLQLITEVHNSRKSIVITKRGQPYAILQAITSSEKPFTIFGCMKDSAEELGDIMQPIDVVWNAQK